jgi:hypothetical protein
MARKWKRWTAEDDEIVRRYYPTLRAHEVADMLSRHPKAISARANFLGIRKCPHRRNGSRARPWTSDELVAMQETYAVLGVNIMAASLGRTTNAIEACARKLGLRVRNDAVSEHHAQPMRAFWANPWKRIDRCDEMTGVPRSRYTRPVNSISRATTNVSHIAKPRRLSHERRIVAALCLLADHLATSVEDR